jgi:NAD(P)-dependent dehydrogenase (short-subunit alcohol dehydrogenase family)
MTIAPCTLITGASKGIGRAIAEKLHAGGGHVVGIARSDDNDFPGDLITVDLTDGDARRSVFAEIANRYHITRLVNNVGFNQMQRLGEITQDRYGQVIDTNLGVMLDATQAFVESMKQAQFGRIINMASRSLLGRKGGSAYAGAKAAMVGFTRSWALELAQSGITVNCVAPGPIRTAMFERNNPPGSESRETLLQAVPMQRMGEPEEVADLAEFLLSERAGYITGQTIFVCGGSSISQQHF